MGATGVYGLPYPELGDTPNVPEDVQGLAEEVEDEFVRVDGDVGDIDTRLAAIEAIFGTAGAAAVSNTQTAIAQTTSGSYTETLTSSNTPAAVAFVAPPSGKVLVHNSAYVDSNGATDRSFLSWILRNGAVIGSGTVVSAANDSWAIQNSGTPDIQCGRTTLVTGLTPGADYNIRQAMKSAGGAVAETQNRHLVVEPVWK